jgi:hypothetical protein
LKYQTVVKQVICDVQAFHLPSEVMYSAAVAPQDTLRCHDIRKTRGSKGHARVLTGWKMRSNAARLELLSGMCNGGASIADLDKIPLLNNNQLKVKWVKLSL